MLALSRSVAVADAQMKQGRWEKKSFQGTELHGKTLGIVGLGRIGREVARRALTFEMTIIAHDPFISTQLAEDLDVELLSLDDLCARADFISLHIPSTADTTQLLNRERLSRCKSGVRIINTARGDLIDEAALADAIASNRVAGAGLDVFQVEPPDATLAGLPQVIATPHIAASTKEAQELVGVETASCLRDFLRSGMVRNAVNFPAVPPEESKRLQPYITLAERLGSLLGQLTEDRITGVGVRYYGELSGKTNEMLVGAVLVGLFRQILSSTVTLVNARLIAQQRGIELLESHSSRNRDFTSLISVKFYTDSDDRWVEGAVFAPNEPRLVLLDGVAIESTLDGPLIVIQNNDQPGVIGAVGTTLGRHGVNIARFTLGRSATGAIGVVNVEKNEDNVMWNEVIKDIQQIPAVLRARLVHV
jgi:D-3-phosphoglycerate dehydrogenase